MTEPTKLSPEEEAREWCQSHIAEWWYWNSATREKYLTSVIAYASHVSAPLKAMIAELEQRIDDMCVALTAGCDREWKDESPKAIAVIAANAIHWRGKRAEAAEARVKELEAENEKIKAEFIKSLIDRGAVDWERVRVRVAELQKREGKR